MKYFTTIEINNCLKQIDFAPALYMDVPLWEITIDDKNYLIRKSTNGNYLSVDSTLSEEVLYKIGSALENLSLKDVG
jgi:hypothetical protein